MVNRPIVNKGNEYITDVSFTIATYTGTQLQIIATPNVRDSSNTNSISTSLYRDGVVDLALIGLGGADEAGFEELSSNPLFYYLYLVGDSTGYKQAGGIASQNREKPILPSGYDMYRKIGYVLANAVVDAPNTIAQYYINGDPNNPLYIMGFGTLQLIASSFFPPPTSFTLTDCLGAVPIENCVVTLNIAYSPNTPGNTVEFRVPG